jgi:hypothetical protein
MAKRKYTFIGKKPDTLKIRELSNTLFRRKPLSKSERNAYIKTGSFFTIIAVICAAVVFLAYYITKATGELADVAFVLGVIGIIVGGFCLGIAFRELAKALKDPRPTSPEAALKEYLQYVLIGEDTNDILEKSAEYAYNYLSRMTPEAASVSREQFCEYIEGFRKTAFAFLLKMHISYFGDKYDGELLKANYKLLKEIETEQSDERAKMLKLFYEVEFIKRGIWRNMGEQTAFADLVICIEMTLVRSGKFWIITDPMPKWEDIMAEYEQIVQESIEKSGGE